MSSCSGRPMMMKRRTRPLTGSIHVERQASIAGSEKRIVEPGKDWGGRLSPGWPRPGTIQMSCAARPPRTQPKCSSPCMVAGWPAGSVPVHSSSQGPTNRQNSMSLSARSVAGPGTWSASMSPPRGGRCWARSSRVVLVGCEGDRRWGPRGPRAGRRATASPPSRPCGRIVVDARHQRLRQPLPGAGPTGAGRARAAKTIVDR